MSELPSSAITEGVSLKSVGESPQEGQLQKVKLSETHSAVAEAHSRITEYINNGLRPEQIEKRLESELTQPETQRQLINEFSPYSEKITPYIKTTEELSVYEQNGLRESKILERPCLQTKIDPERKDAMGWSNRERMEAGRAPVDENGDSMNLHHIGQKANSPLAELPDRVHKECDGVLHDKLVPTEVHGEGNNWGDARAQYWQARVTTI